jgi:hypothetical protein
MVGETVRFRDGDKQQRFETLFVKAEKWVNTKVSVTQAVKGDRCYPA